MLKKIGKYNDVSAALMPDLPEKGTIVQYQFLHVYHNPIKNISGRTPGKTDEIHYQYARKCPVTSNFFDTKKDQFVPIGLIDNIDQNGNITRQFSYYFKPMENHGFLTLTIGESAEMDRLWTYLELASFVERDNPEWRRDETEELIMRKVDNEKEAKRLRDKRVERKLAMDMAYNLQDEELLRVAVLLSMDTNQKPDIIRNLVEDYAEKFSAAFLKQMSDPHIEYKALGAQAIDLGVLTVNRETGMLQYTSTGGSLMMLSGFDDINNQFAMWLNDPSNKLSEGHLKNIKTLVEDAGKNRKRRGRPALEK